MAEVTTDILRIVGRIAVRQIQRRIRERRVGPPTRNKAVTLFTRGLLLRSVKAEVNQSQVILSAGGADVPYARIHHEGGIIRPRTAKFLAIPLTPQAKRSGPRQFQGDTFIAKGIIFSKDENGKITPQYALKKEVRMPARPYMFLDDHDRVLIEDACRERIQRSIDEIKTK
jgi:phage gpG-like protein